VQTTLATSVSVSGLGLHAGLPARVTLRPASAGAGLAFRRTDLRGVDPVVPALWDRVTDTRLSTRVSNDAGASVGTVEHLMAALAGTGVHNAVIDVDGPEVPIMDGSAAPWARAILQAGLRQLDAPLRALRVRRPVEVSSGGATARLEPALSLRIDFAIDFPAAAIGRQALALDLANGAFLRELCDARTFCLLQDVEGMRGTGRALGGSVANAVVVDGARVLNPGGLRRPDEFVRHKMLDALGDLATAGAPILGRYTGRRAGHGLTNLLLRELFSRPDAWEMVGCDAALLRRLPGAGLAPADLAAVA
jgi:UDP-3-O-[3-hydroxymyristoyl] N-acetylglucosamine deacetylase